MRRVREVSLVDPKELPRLPREPVCPAALAVTGATRECQGVVCRVMQRDHEQDAGLDMTAAASGFIQREATGGVFLDLAGDPSTVTAFCYGDALPVLTDDDGQGRASYSYCPTWQAEKMRIAEGREELLEEPEPEPVSMGVSSVDALDPWAQAREDLDLLAPEEQAWR